MSTINALDDTGASRPPQPTSASAPASRVALKTDIVVIGAGQAGLSSAYHLKKRALAPGRGFVVLDQSPQPGAAWQFRWLEDLVADGSYALRAFRRRPTFALAAIACSRVLPAYANLPGGAARIRMNVAAVYDELKAAGK